jgi:hypothetical protein
MSERFDLTDLGVFFSDADDYWATVMGRNADGEEDDDFDRFRAGLYYVASDLRQLATDAPAGKSAELLALSRYILSLASD